MLSEVVFITTTVNYLLNYVSSDPMNILSIGLSVYTAWRAQMSEPAHQKLQAARTAQTSQRFLHLCILNTHGLYRTRGSKAG
jgi:hypothetical protein